LGGWELPRFLLIYLYTYFKIIFYINNDNFYSLIYDLDIILIDNFIYVGIVINYYFSNLFEKIVFFYEINFVIISYYLQIKFQNFYDIYEICLYVFFNK
jgi:hypothetical protein